MSETQPQIEIRVDSSVRTPRWLKGIFVGGFIFLLILLVGLSLGIESYFDRGYKFFIDYEKFECEPFSTWPLDFQLFAILYHTREALIFPAILHLVYYAFFDVSWVNKRGAKVAMPLTLILLSILCSSCYVSFVINATIRTTMAFEQCAPW
jgi:hypothetical protein